MLVGHKGFAALLQAIEDKGRPSLQEASHSHRQAAKIYFRKAYASRVVRSPVLVLIMSTRSTRFFGLYLYT